MRLHCFLLLIALLMRLDHLASLQKRVGRIVFKTSDTAMKALISGQVLGPGVMNTS